MPESKSDIPSDLSALAGYSYFHYHLNNTQKNIITRSNVFNIFHKAIPIITLKSVIDSDPLPGKDTLTILNLQHIV